MELIRYKDGSTPTKLQKQLAVTDDLQFEFLNNIESMKKKFIAAREDYLIKKAEQDRVKKIDLEVKNKVLAQNAFKVSDKRERGKHGEKEIIKTHLRDYLMSDEDFKIYLNLCHDKRLKAGLKIPEANLSSDYLTSKAMKKAEDKFIEIALSMLPESLRKDLKSIGNHWKHRKTFIDFSLKLKIK